MSGGNAGEKAGRGGPSPWSRRRAQHDEISEVAGEHLAAAARRESQPCDARLLAGSLRGRRILLEALQMRGDQLVVGGDRRRRRAAADGRRRRRLAFGFQRLMVRGTGIASSASSPPPGLRFGFTGAGLCSDNDCGFRTCRR